MKALPQVSRDLLEAARIVERGWCQNLLKDGDKRCAGGAILQACKGDYDRRVIALTAFNKHIGAGWLITEWNDAPERTQAEVVKALQDAAMEAAK